jgi:general stress protein 26
MSILEELKIPKARPARKVPGYQMPETDDQLLAWDFVVEQMLQAKYYWISTVNQNGGPHAVPLWGVWYDNRVHFDGRTETAWSKNLMQESRIAVHLPDAEKVVIVYGNAYTIEDDELNEEQWHRLDSAYQTKYQVQEGSPWWYVKPNKVLAWNGGNLRTMTRWIFE